jgi:acetyl esterase/lipase
MRFGRGYNNNIEGALRVWKNYQSKPEDQLNPYFTPLRAESLENLPKALIIMGNVTLH